MAATPTIFVQIAAYRDPECLPTIADMFAKAKHPSRIHAGLCWQYKKGAEPAEPALSQAHKKQVRVASVPVEETEGPSWAKRRAQGFYDGEDYVLMIDSHMRFVPGWDEKLLAEWKACGSKRAILSAYPPGYTPPDTLSINPALTVLRAHTPTPSGDIRFRGERLATAPAKPLRGAFAAPGFLFAPGALVGEVPYDPYLYFDQEEMCLSARLFTHGWEVFHPSQILLYHLYDSAPVAYPRHKHWNDHTGWQHYSQRARERREHLLGAALATSEAALKELDKYGHGDAHTLEEFEAFCGINFREKKLSEKAVTCGFIPGIEKLLERPINPAQLLAPEAGGKKEEGGASPGSAPKLPSAFMHVPVSAFMPKQTNILRQYDAARFFAPAPKNADTPKPRRITKGVPPGVLMVKDFLPPWACKQLVDYARVTAGRKLEVVDNARSGRDKVATMASSGRITDQVPINAVADEILPLFIDIYARRLAPFYGVEFEWFERPQILRYSAGGKYDPHADAEHVLPGTNNWVRSQDRDISVLLYLNDEYEGGELGFDKLNYQFKPEAGMLLAFPSDHRYLHAARPTLSGIRCVIVSWAAVLGTPRVKASAPYASVFLSLRK